MEAERSFSRTATNILPFQLFNINLGGSVRERETGKKEQKGERREKVGGEERIMAGK